jgi:hypothetical protein
MKSALKLVHELILYYDARSKNIKLHNENMDVEETERLIAGLMFNGKD